ncbi:MAG: endolytic transglycosylase MltG [Lentimicrobiaceae bacterium]|nr:endolytic transglycosylase MltG [Lentimicrobiaceae bacterium]
MMNKRIKILIFAGGTLFLMGAVVACLLYWAAFSNNMQRETKESVRHIYIPTGASCDDVLEILEENKVLKNKKSFEWIAKIKQYPSRIRSGRYRIDRPMSNNNLVNRLRSGSQEAVDFTFNNIRTKEQFAKRVADQLEMTPVDLLDLLNDNDFLAAYNLNSETALTIFVPNTYKIWWNTSAEDFVKKMYREYEKFWTEERKAKAAQIPLSPTEVVILAAVVEEENHRRDEQARIAGLYINRLRIGMPLQACPTVKFALNDFAKQSLSYSDLEVNSPYNTYKIAGLPPTPIRIPSPSCVDEVLNYEKHNYLYMCAKEDFSGYHNFTANYSQHLSNAAKYHNALNHNKIKK